MMAILFGLATEIILAWFIIASALSGGWRVTVDFNSFGEGVPELAISLASIILSFLALSRIRSL